MNTVPFLVAILGLLVVAYVVWFTYASKKKHVEPTVRQTRCPISFRGERLTPCKTNAECSACDNRTCTTVTSEDPYRYKMAGETLTVPEGKWCLPPRIMDMPCNEITGDRVLTHNPLFVNYSWQCHCKNPEIVRNAGVYGDCIEVVACGDGELVCPPGSDKCTPGTKWKDTRDWDPKIGVCDCPVGQKYVVHEGRKLCETDECYPGRVSGEGCECPHPVQVAGGWKSTIPVGNKCITDPCNPEGYTHGGRCVCKPGSIPFEDALSPTGWICKSPCNPADNPCGNKGRCIFDADGKVNCTDCRYPNYQSPDGMCSNIVKHGNVECQNNYECETRVCDSFFAPIWKLGDGKKYCSPY